MAGKGGYMPGGGRPKGALGKKNQEMIEKAAAEGIMPKDLLLNDMRYYHKTAEFEISRLRTLPQTAENVELLKLALSYKVIARECAEKVAPYYHPKLSSVDAKVTVNNQETALAELE
jgi:hypothetical protein